MNRHGMCSKSKAFFILFLLAISHNVFTQNTIVEYEYWFNDDFNNRIITNITPVDEYHLNTNISVSNLTNGINVINFRAKDSQGKYSVIASQYFYKIEPTGITNNRIVSYEYWYDDDFQNKISVNISPAEQATILAQLDVSVLSNGMHILNFRTKDERGYYSSIGYQYFYTIEPTGITNNRIVSYEYWYDDDFQNKISVNISPAEQATILAQLDVSGLSNGMHILNFRTKDERGYYSSIVYQYFYKKKFFTYADNKIIAYKYWFDNDYNNLILVNLPVPVDNLHLINLVNMTRVPKGIHTINFQFKDDANIWSVVTTDTIEKISLPIADFSYVVLSSNCDSTVIAFTDNSIDGDVYLWDFADGSTDTSKSPIHVFHNSGIHSVSLTVRDTITLSDSTKQMNILITGKTAHSFAVTSYDSYISPSGNYTYTTSGIYYDTITNHWGCDSLLTINLNIMPSYFFTENHTICQGDTYSWHGQTLNTAGVYYDNLQTINGCDSIYKLTLSVNPTYLIEENHAICQGDTYSWHGQTLNTAGVYYDNLQTTNGCDSIYKLTLSVNPTYLIEENHAICQGDTYSWHGQTLNNAGVYYDNLQTINGCDSIYKLTLSVNQSPIVNLGNDTTVCGAGITLNAGSGFTSYQWSTGASTQLITVNSSDTYSVTVTNAQNCSNSDEINVTISNISINLEQIGTDLVATIDPVVLGVYTWYTCDNQLVPNITTSTYQNATVDECFYVIFTDEVNCEWISNEVIVVTIDENVLPIASIYPNPATDKLIIELANNNGAIIYLYDIIGKQLNKFNLDENKLIIDVTELEGTYILKIITNDNTIANFKIIITK